MALHCNHLFFSGKVQGVFFRATSQQLARELRISGWVRNLQDGRVEMQAQGSEEQLTSLVEHLQERFTIKKVERKEIDCSDAFADFQIIR